MALAVPAIGWPLFILLGFGYFVMNYMLVGGIFLQHDKGDGDFAVDLVGP